VGEADGSDAPAEAVPDLWVLVDLGEAVSGFEYDLGPMPTVDEIPLHPTPQGPSPTSHWACFEPERPWDEHAMFDWRCPACVIYAEAVLRTHGDMQMHTGGDMTGPGGSVVWTTLFGGGRLSTYIEYSKAWFEGHR
jgi:hypothetical protein